jgi:REP element-mobilizing transposase RayT
LRGSANFRVIRRALTAGQERFGFRLVHFSVQSNHLHLIAEARDRRALSRGMQGLAVRVAKAVNRRLQRRGTVFADRYYSRAMQTPRDVWLGLRYVLSNVRKHVRGPGRLPAGYVDACSSAPWFDSWSRPREMAFVGNVTARAGPAPVVCARTWLLRVGWKRAGLLDVDDAPWGS